MSVKMRQEVEEKIVGQFVRDALAAGHRLSVSFERGYDLDEMVIASRDYDQIMTEAFSGDVCWIFVHDIDEPTQGPTTRDGFLIADGWVYCVHGNGEYVISDYTVNLEPLLVEANKIAKHYMD